MSNKEKTLDYNPPTTSSHSSPCSEWAPKLAKLNKEIRRCRKCPLWKTRKNAVPGEGPVNTKIMLLGQAPGAQEDIMSRPFVGRAGQFLDKLLTENKIDREEIYITNPVKCFPPHNRKPKKEELRSCFPYLKKEIEIINPKKIILLGEVAFSSFFKKEKLKSFRGKWFKKDNKDFFISYAPSAAIRFPKIRKILEEDFKKVNT